ncbi:probable siderophore iron transporter mirC [Melanopsichium pennsylvanicum]|uniref:Probable siderophore iron transporter mirC n=2 Tax=Melanopsichium pennsylvanicum TaxID=63383 RepID=A0AAJ5C4Z2_9BASI|nr:probable siderophore iron transporter mirC [Melanopsichium pennsylvanicum 4]SNX83999.1 probable siderophore iron transporter mirC [Melanopsichium pennsylvanicum]
MSQPSDVEHIERLDASQDAHAKDEGHTDKQIGVIAAEAGRSVADWTLWVGILGIALVAYLAGLDNNTMWAWQTAATTQFGQYPSYTAITVVQAVLIAVGKFPIAKLADVFGRAQAYGVSLFFWVLGFIIIAVSQDAADVAGGTVLYAIGNTGIQIMQQIVLADYISTKWRGASIGLVSLPYVINFAVASKITTALTTKTGPAGTSVPSATWRWGPGFFAICAPVAAFSIILALAINQRRAKAKGLVPVHPYKRLPWTTAIHTFLVDTDALGLFLICAGFLMFLLPLNLAKLQTDGWSTGWIIAMLVIGGVMIIAFWVWELYAPKPILNRRWRLNRDVHFATAIGFFDFFSFYSSWVPAYYWSLIVMDYDNQGATYFSNCQSLSLTVFGIIAGFISAGTKNYKWVMVSGAVIRMVGIGLMIKYREAGSSNFQAVMPQVLQGLGGGFLGITLQVAAQISVRHQDVATVTAYFLLLTEIGGACGNAVVGAVQTNVLPGYYEKYAPMLNATERAAIYASPFGVSAYPIGSAARTGIINAYNEYVHTLLIVAIVLSVPPIILGLFMSNRKLGDKQNCVSNELAGMRRLSADSGGPSEGSIDKN